MKLTSVNPATGKILGEVEVSTKKEIRDKVEKAIAAKEKWEMAGIEGRVLLLEKLLAEFSKRKEEIALLITKEMGMPISQSRIDAEMALSYFRWYLENAEKYLSPEVIAKEGTTTHRVFYEPIGVAAVIVPWNFPFSNFIWGAGQNLIAGNPVVFKHSEECPLAGKLIEEIVKSVNLPAGVFSEVYGGGEVGDCLAHQNIDLISFTGSCEVGKYLYRLAAKKFIRAVMELGGSAAGIVFKDADIDKVLETIYLNRFANAGQACDALKRLIVHKDRFNEMVEKLRKKLKSVKIGDPEDSTTDIGPLVSERQLKKLEAQIREALIKKATTVIGGKRPKGLKGFYFEPTILINITPDMKVWREEVFGPVLPIISFSTEEEAVVLANDTKYGLGGYIFTEDIKKAQRIALKLKTGMVGINNASYLQPYNPFGGYKNSGMGREHGEYGFHELTRIKVVSAENN